MPPKRYSHVPELTPYGPALGRLVPEWRQSGLASSSESSIIIGEGVLRLLQMMDAGSGVLLVLEDVHWADPESLAVVEYLADHAAETRLACVVTARPQPSPGLAVLNALMARRSAVGVELSALDDDETARIVLDCLEAATLPRGLSDLVARPAGVPFLVEELVAAAAEVGALVQEGCRWRFQPSSSAIVPRTLADSINQRLESLSPSEREVPRVAALFGRHIDPGMVAQALHATVAATTRVLDRCVELQLIAIDASGGYQFRHALTRESVLAGMNPGVRLSLAEHVLIAVERTHPDLPGPWCQAAADLSGR